MEENTTLNPPTEAESAAEIATTSTAGAENVEAGSSTPMMSENTNLEDKRFAKAASVQIREPPVTETRGYEIVAVKDKHGPLYQAIPIMPLPFAAFCCLFNIVLPGTGTLLSAFSVFCCGQTKLDKPCKAFGLNIATALLQMVTFLVIVGWIWSIRWGMNFVQLSLSARKGKNVDQLPYYVRRQSSVNYEKQQSKVSKT